jgi:hypothetical protein
MRVTRCFPSVCSSLRWGAAFVSYDFQFPALHLIKECQHQTRIQCSNQKVFWTPDVRDPFEGRRVTNFDRWVLWSRQCSSKPGRPGNDVSELESTEYLFLFHGLSLGTLGKK